MLLLGCQHCLAQHSYCFSGVDVDVVHNSGNLLAVRLEVESPVDRVTLVT